ncbi:hypothetical protein Mal33_37250 [Rosistilla oblonga]|uniref:Uncharacterized protein n=1 Tax=Rosistilla oblonga TaxID=2527990 RepID=A0A518IX94_9BACT|nr:hypothetical protein Mal33_37250 [Rosistilla oblonga]
MVASQGIDLPADPIEMPPDESRYYDDWFIRHKQGMVPLKDLVAKFMGAFKEFPPRQESGSFTPKQQPSIEVCAAPDGGQAYENTTAQPIDRLCCFCLWCEASAIRSITFRFRNLRDTDARASHWLRCRQ